MRKELFEKIEAYERAVLELINIDRLDVIVTSGVEDTGKDGPMDESNWDNWT